VAVKDAGGRVIAESEQSAVIFGMPKQAIRTGAVDQVVPLGEIAAAIQDGTRRVQRSGERKLA
jgi:two-component system chemotaxis response regulator CheB